MNKTFTAILRKEDNLYVAECPEASTASQGETIEEAIANLKEATELYLEEFPFWGIHLTGATAICSVYGYGQKPLSSQPR